VSIDHTTCGKQLRSLDLYDKLPTTQMEGFALTRVGLPHAVAASLSNNVNTSKSITLLVQRRSTLQF